MSTNVELTIRTMVKRNEKGAAIKNENELSSIDPTVNKRKTRVSGKLLCQ